VSLEMHLEVTMVELRDALGGHDRASLEMHLDALIEQDWRCTWRRLIGGALDAETLSIN